MSFVGIPSVCTHQMEVLDVVLGGSEDDSLLLVADDMLEEVVEEGKLVLRVTLKERHLKVFREHMLCV